MILLCYFLVVTVSRVERERGFLCVCKEKSKVVCVCKE